MGASLGGDRSRLRSSMRIDLLGKIWRHGKASELKARAHPIERKRKRKKNRRLLVSASLLVCVCVVFFHVPHLLSSFKPSPSVSLFPLLAGTHSSDILQSFSFLFLFAPFLFSCSHSRSLHTVFFAVDLIVYSFPERFQQSAFASLPRPLPLEPVLVFFVPSPSTLLPLHK